MENASRVFNEGKREKEIRAKEKELEAKYQSRTNLCRSIKEAVENKFADNIRIFEEPVAYSIKAAEQAVNGTSIFDYDEKSGIAMAYASLAREVDSRA